MSRVWGPDADATVGQELVPPEAKVPGLVKNFAQFGEQLGRAMYGSEWEEKRAELAKARNRRTWLFRLKRAGQFLAILPVAFLATLSGTWSAIWLITNWPT